MRTVLAEPPPVLGDWLERRRALGQDRFDEVWEGEYHVAPGPHWSYGDVGDQVTSLLSPLARSRGLRGITTFNLGSPDDYRVPGSGYVRERPPASAFVPTAAVVVEIVSPRDDTWRKLDFYYARGVEELLVVDPATRAVTWFARGAAGFEARPASALLDYSGARLSDEIDWPDVEPEEG